MIHPSQQRRTIAVAALLGLAFALLAALVVTRWSPLLQLDLRVAAAAYDAVRDRPWAVDFWKFLAKASEPALVRAALCLLAAFYFRRGSRRTAAWIVAAVFGSLLAVWAAKNLFGRARPVFSPPITEIDGYSFPSGHAVGAGMAASLLILLAAATVGHRSHRLALAGLWMTLAALVGLDRILLGVHYLSDVVGGLLLGSFVTMAANVAMGGIGVGPARVAAKGKPPAAPSRRLGVVLNPAKIDAANVFRRRVDAAAQGAGWDEPLWFETTVDDAGAAMAEAALAAGVDVVAVAGGDGTVRTVCARMARSDVPVAIIPTGTGNLLARNLGLPLVTDAALQIVFNGRDRAVDMVRINGDELAEDHFVVMAGLGLDAAIMAGAPEAMKAKMGWPAYAVSALRHIRYPAVRMDISVDGAPPERFRARTVVIGNVGNLQAGIPLLPEAVIDDGRLDVVVIAPRRSLGWISLVWRVMLRRPGTDERLARMTGHRVVVRAAHPTPRQIDGDLVEPGQELHAEVQAGVLLVRVPH